MHLHPEHTEPHFTRGTTIVVDGGMSLYPNLV